MTSASRPADLDNGFARDDVYNTLPRNCTECGSTVFSELIPRERLRVELATIRQTMDEVLDGSTIRYVNPADAGLWQHSLHAS